MKYGLENLKFEILEECEVCDLDEKELIYIKKFNSFDNGYNLTKGGDGTLGRIITDTTRVKMSESLKGKKRSKEIRAKFRKINKERWSDPQYRLKMENRPRYYGSEAPRSKKVICINDKIVFDSLTLAGEYYGIDLKKVSAVCTGSKSYTGLKETGRKLEFAFYEEGKEYILKRVKHNNEKRKVKCLTTGKIFNSICEASEESGVHKGSISKVCKGERNYAGKLPDGTKLEWEFVGY